MANETRVERDWLFDFDDFLTVTKLLMTANDCYTDQDFESVSECLFEPEKGCGLRVEYSVSGESLYPNAPKDWRKTDYSIDDLISFHYLAEEYKLYCYRKKSSHDDTLTAYVDFDSQDLVILNMIDNEDIIMKLLDITIEELENYDKRDLFDDLLSEIASSKDSKLASKIFHLNDIIIEFIIKWKKESENFEN